MVEAAPSVSAAARLVGAVRCDYYASQQGSLRRPAITRAHICKCILSHYSSHSHTIFAATRVNENFCGEFRIESKARGARGWRPTRWTASSHAGADSGSSAHVTPPDQGGAVIGLAR